MLFSKFVASRLIDRHCHCHCLRVYLSVYARGPQKEFTFLELLGKN